MVETIGEAVESVSGTVSGIARAIRGVKRYVWSFINLLSGDFIPTADRLESRRRRTSKGSGIYPPQNNSPVTADQAGKLDRRSGRPVAHAIGGKRISRAETDVEGKEYTVLNWVYIISRLTPK
jgi:hypothetical protein